MSSTFCPPPPLFLFPSLFSFTFSPPKHLPTLPFTMARDNLYITVPTHFRCPISLDVMKSPVSLSTGVTYDRSSIQRWLDSGNNTCPATMQVLQSKEFVPNCNLKRLIQIWSDSVNLRVLDFAVSTLSQSVTSEDEIVSVFEDLQRNGNDRNCSVSLSKLVCFARRSEQNVKFLGKLDGLVPVLVDVLGGENCRDIDSLEQVVRVLDLVRCEIEDREELMSLMLKSNRDCLKSLLVVLQQGSTESRSGTARLLECIAINAESKLVIGEKEGILHELIGLIGIDRDPRLIESVLSCLISISMPKRIKIKLVHLGAIKSLTRLLLQPNSNSSMAITEKVLKLLATLSSVEEGRSEMCENGGECVAGIVRKVMKVSSAGTEHAVTALWCICYLFREERAAEAVAEANGLPKILLLMQSHCPAPVRQMAKDLLKIFKGVRDPLPKLPLLLLRPSPPP